MKLPAYLGLRTVQYLENIEVEIKQSDMVDYSY